MGEFKMPSLGADMEAGTVTRWLVGPGDRVDRGDIVAVVDTEKSTIEVEIFESGVIDRLLVGEGEEVAVGTPLATVTATGAATAPATAPSAAAPPVPAAPAPAAPAPAAAVPVAVPAPAPAPSPAAPAPAPVPAVTSPVVRHLAERLGVDLTTVAGTAPGGRVTRSDVERAGARPTAARTAAPAAAGRPHRRASPRARRLAAEAGLDLGSVTGSGPLGAVVAGDVTRALGSSDGRSPATAAEAPAGVPVSPAGVPVSPTGVEVSPAAAVVSPAAAPGGAGGDGRGGGSGPDRREAMRRAIGALMARSKREIPHYYLGTTIDMTAATGWLARANDDRPVADRLVLPVLLLKAVAAAVAAVPEVNGFYVDDRFVAGSGVHLGVAVSMRGGGVIAPAIHDVDRLDLDTLMQKLRSLVSRARSGSLRSSEMSDPTLTVTNLGDMGVESVFGVIYPPQVALVGFGRVTPRAWARDGMLGVVPCVTATLAADHRVSDGHRGGRYLAEIDRLLQEPEGL